MPDPPLLGQIPVGPHGAIGLLTDLCTSCMICVRECPSWCITLQAERHSDAPVGRRARSTLVLTSFEIDFGLCIDCGLCVDACPTDALVWVPDPLPAGATTPQLRADITTLAALAASVAAGR